MSMESALREEIQIMFGHQDEFTLVAAIQSKNVVISTLSPEFVLQFTALAAGRQQLFAYMLYKAVVDRGGTFEQRLGVRMTVEARLVEERKDAVVLELKVT